MMSTEQTLTPGETHLIDRLINRLATDWPQFSRQEITQAVDGHVAELSGSTVRDYLLVLVERATEDDLRERNGGEGHEGHGPLWTREASQEAP